MHLTGRKLRYTDLTADEKKIVWGIPPPPNTPKPQPPPHPKKQPVHIYGTIAKDFTLFQSSSQ